jgi:hypothetical protein
VPKKEAAPSWTDKVKLSARAYLRYSYELGEAARNNNQFNLDRLYVQSEYLATDKVRFQITLDGGVTRNTAGNQVFLAETKAAFIEVKDVLAPGLYLRAGLLQLAWATACRARYPWIVGATPPRRTWGWPWEDRCPPSTAASR